ncbi:hypothetical protein PoB_003883700 [Plakobranchus ocellatus]|uniref:Uncharacterized protein n=1 Tax=Plakobranchus ocellatus TaxID=259542 RepID=A0AAV4AZL0_9GAST|nr:hypothetical protein PoB_003883700 [Plakobranchus ocellatus]
MDSRCDVLHSELKNLSVAGSIPSSASEACEVRLTEDDASLAQMLRRAIGKPSGLRSGVSDRSRKDVGLNWVAQE